MNLQTFYKNIYSVSLIGTIVCVDAGVAVRYTTDHTPGESKRLSWVLDDPAAGGEVVCGVIVAVATQTWKTDWL